MPHFAVLVAISIPIFTSQLEKSRDAVSVANMRSAYAEAATAYLTGTGGGNATVNLDSNNKIQSVTVADVVFKGTVSSDQFSGLAKELPFTNAESLTEPASGDHDITFTWSGDECTAAIDAGTT